MAAESQRPMVLKYPRQVFLIIVNEFSVLVLFLNEKLLLSQDDATIVFHAFNMTCYLFPVVGGIISDSWLGKYRTILCLSLVYAVGNVVVALASWSELRSAAFALTCLGLVLIGMGTGGIKPCVSSFGGDQFVLPQQSRQLAQFFSVFYFVINAGGGLSIVVSPELRTLPCLGETTCYPLSFGTPALIMLIFCCVFVSGKRWYVMKEPEGNVLFLVCKCIWSAIRNRCRGHRPELELNLSPMARSSSSSATPLPTPSAPPHAMLTEPPPSAKPPAEPSGTTPPPLSEPPATPAHWLDSADTHFGAQLVSDIKVLLRLLVLAIPLPVFWALFDMQGSRWTFQAKQLDGQVGGWRILPDQMQLFGVVFVLILLPMFEAWLHPALRRCGLLATPLQRMSVGGLMAAAAFVSAAVVQLQNQSVGDASILWQIPQYFFIALADIWFAIAVLEFGYREAPVSMKSSITALFQLTTAIGDILVIIITSSKLFENMATEFFVYAGLMTAVMCVFIYLASRYKYVDDTRIDEKRIT